MEKPREFWIELGNECDDIVWHKPVNERTIHVIEYSAYKHAQYKVEWLLNDSTELQAQCENLASVLMDTMDSLPNPGRTRSEVSKALEEYRKWKLELIEAKANEFINSILSFTKALADDTPIKG